MSTAKIFDVTAPQVLRRKTTTPNIKVETIGLFTVPELNGSYV
jgi:hypothetical protein